MGSTVSGNNGNGIFNFNYGGGGNSRLEVTGSTIANNNAVGNGGDIRTYTQSGAGNTATTTLRNTIIAGNTPNNLATGTFNGGAATVTTNGFNLASDGGGGFLNVALGDKINTNAGITALADNGGATPTHDLLLGSAAIDAGNNSGSGVLTDQRGAGFNRTIDLPVANAANGDGTDISAFEALTVPTATKTLFDFDGDGKADVSVFRPTSGIWYLLQSQSGFTGIQFGVSTDKIVPADYDGDGKTDVAVYRGGTWYLNRSQLGFTGVAFGTSDDIPIPADYDGDGKADIAVFRPSTGVWYLLRSQLGFTGVTFGQSGDVPAAADYETGSTKTQKDERAWLRNSGSGKNRIGDLHAVGTSAVANGREDQQVGGVGQGVREADLRNAGIAAGIGG